MNKLWGFRFYLCGPMDLCPNNGVEWRREITPFLENMGGIVLDPTRKPIDLISEQPEDIKAREELKEKGLYEEYSKQIKLLRCVDLRCVDLSDVLIINLDLDIPTCGTFEEMDWANRCKKPLLVRFKQGKKKCNGWNFGKIPHEHIFSTWDELRQYITNVDLGLDTRHFKRFFFFEYEKMMPKRPPNTQNDGRKYRLEWVEDNQ